MKTVSDEREQHVPYLSKPQLYWCDVGCVLPRKWQQHTKLWSETRGGDDERQNASRSKVSVLKHVPGPFSSPRRRAVWNRVGWVTVGHGTVSYGRVGWGSVG